MATIARLIDPDYAAEFESTGHTTSRINSALDAAEKALNDEETARIDADATESKRAIEAENALSKKVEDETMRATAAEEKLDGEIASEAKRAADAEEALSAKVDDEITRATSIEAKLQTSINTETNRATAAEDTLDASIKENAGKIATLNGDSTVEGSVDSKVTKAIAKIVADAPEDFDTLKEVADYIAAHKTEAAELIVRVSKNESAIGTLNGTEETAGSVANTVAAAKTELTEQIATETTRATEAESDISSQISSETTARASAIDSLEKSLSSKISDETDARTAADEAETARAKAEEEKLASRATALEDSASKEETARIDADTALESKLAAEASRAEANESSLSALVADTKAELLESISSNTSKIDILSGDGTVEGSVASQVASGVAKVIADAPEDFDTLKEIADYIASDKTNAAQLASKVNANEKAIAALNGDTATAGSVSKAISDALSPYDTKISQITAKVNENSDRSIENSRTLSSLSTKVDNETTRATTAESGLAEKLDALIARVEALEKASAPTA